jgi:hypothetical protein
MKEMLELSLLLMLPLFKRNKSSVFQAELGLLANKPQLGQKILYPRLAT